MFAELRQQLLETRIELPLGTVAVEVQRQIV